MPTAETEGNGSGDDVTTAAPAAPAPYRTLTTWPPTAVVAPSLVPTVPSGDSSNEVDGPDLSERSDENGDSKTMPVILAQILMTVGVLVVLAIAGVFIWRSRSERANGGNTRVSRPDVVRMQRQHLESLATITNPTFDGPIPDGSGLIGGQAAGPFIGPAADDGQPQPHQTATAAPSALRIQPTSRPVYKTPSSWLTDAAVGAHTTRVAAPAQTPAKLPGASTALYDTVTMVRPDGMGGSVVGDGGPVAPPRGESLKMWPCTACNFLNEVVSLVCERCDSHSYATPSTINHPLAGGSLHGQPARANNSPHNRGRIGIGHDYGNPLGATKQQPSVNPPRTGHDYATNPNGGRPVYKTSAHRPNLHSIDTASRPAGMSFMEHVGVALIKRPEGLVIVSVQPGGYGQSRGLSTGKVVHTLNGANARAMQLQEFVELFEATLGTVDLELMDAVSRIQPQLWRAGMGSIGLTRPTAIGVDNSYDGGVVGRAGTPGTKMGYASARAAAPPRITSTGEPEYEEIDHEPQKSPLCAEQEPTAPHAYMWPTVPSGVVFSNYSADDEDRHLAGMAAGDDRGDGGGDMVAADTVPDGTAAAAAAAQLYNTLTIVDDDTEV